MKRRISNLMQRHIDAKKAEIVHRSVGRTMGGPSKESLRAMAEAAIEECPARKIETGKKTMTRARWVY